jgi:hypothetical protein
MLPTPLSSEKLRPEWKYIAEVTNEDEMFSLLRPIDGSFARRDLILLKITHVVPDDLCVNMDISGMLSLAVRPSFKTAFADSMSDEVEETAALPFDSLLKQPLQGPLPFEYFFLDFNYEYNPNNLSAHYQLKMVGYGGDSGGQHIIQDVASCTVANVCALRRSGQLVLNGLVDQGFSGNAILMNGKLVAVVSGRLPHFGGGAPIATLVRGLSADERALILQNDADGDVAMASAPSSSSLSSSSSSSSSSSLSSSSSASSSASSSSSSLSLSSPITTLPVISDFNQIEYQNDQRAATCAPHLNGSAFDVFICHSRRDPRSVLLAEAIWGSLTSQHGLKVWLDVKMADKSEAAMEHGVRNSKMVIAIVNREALNPDRPDDNPEHTTLFQRAYCVQELRWAKEAGKIIQPTIRFEDKQNIGDMMSLAPDDLQFMGETEFIELERNDGAYWNVGIRKLRERLRRPLR